MSLQTSAPAHAAYLTCPMPRGARGVGLRHVRKTCGGNSQHKLHAYSACLEHDTVCTCCFDLLVHELPSVCGLCQRYDQHRQLLAHGLTDMFWNNWLLGISALRCSASSNTWAGVWNLMTPLCCTKHNRVKSLPGACAAATALLEAPPHLSRQACT